jgi:hypothetical protein
VTRFGSSRIANVALTASLALACAQQSETSGAPARARAGIFFGGQIQNRAEWPLILDETRQTQGFRIDFARAVREPTHVRWEVVRPTAKQRKHALPPIESATSTFEATVAVGTDHFDQLIHFDDGDRPGEWRLRVLVNGASILDRSIRVVPKSAAIQDD